MAPKLRVVIDPGHGLPDPGCVDDTPGRVTSEAAQNLSVALTLKFELEAAGFEVDLTRIGPNLPGPAGVTRAQAFVNRTTGMGKCWAYIAVHHDIPKVTQHNKFGCVYYVKGVTGSEYLARNITARTGGYVEADTDEVRFHRLYIRDALSKQAVLWEVGPLCIRDRAQRLLAVAPVVAALVAARRAEQFDTTK